MSANNMSFSQFESFLNLYLHDKLPSIPEGLKSFIVKVTPWVDLIMIILVVPIALLALGLGAFVESLSFLPGSRGAYFNGGILSYIFLFAPLVLQAIALPGLFKRTASGWNFSFYAVLATGIGYILNLNFGSLVGTAISLYFLFQVRSMYSGLPALSYVPSATIPTPPTPNSPQAPTPPSTPMV